MDFKWEMQERIDRGMNPDEAYNETRDSYAGYSDNEDRLIRFFEDNPWEVCNCTCDNDCECKEVREEEE